MALIQCRPIGSRLRILFITWTRLGDAVLSTGLLDHLAHREPQARITVVCGALPAPLFRAAPGVERVLPLAKARLGGHWIAPWRACVGTAWDLVVDLRDTPVSRLLRARRRHVWRRSRRPQHKVAEVAAVAGVDPPPAPRLWLDPPTLAAAERLVPPGAPVLALGPTANWRGKEWPAERFVALARRLCDADGILPGARIAVFAAAPERERAAGVLAPLPPDRRIDLIGRADPLTIGACLSRCALYVGNDSGLMHIAAAAGVPTLGLFGPGYPHIYRPWGDHTAVVAAPWPERGPRPKGPVMMAQVELQTVAVAAEQLWRRLQGVARGPDQEADQGEGRSRQHEGD